MPKQLESAQRRLACLYSVSELLATYDGRDACLDAVFAAAITALGLDVIVLAEQSESEPRLRWGKRDQILGDDVAAAVVLAKASLAYYVEEGASPPASPRGTAIVLPLAKDRQTLGVLCVERRAPFDELDLAFVSALTNQLAVAIDRDHAWTVAQAAIRARDHVLAVVSHDLRNMLTSILITTQLAVEVVPPVENRRFGNKSFSLIRTQAQRMDRLIRDLVDLASIETKRIQVTCAALDVGQLLAEVVESFAPLATQQQVVLGADVADGIPPVFADRDRVLQVFSNLVGNALKFTPAKGTIRLETKVLLDKVLLSVRDSGPGISAEQQPHIFDRYWQAQRTAKLGTGLGLSIAKGIVEALGGRIWVESREGNGTLFTFSLPRALPEQQDGRCFAPRRVGRGDG